MSPVIAPARDWEAVPVDFGQVMPGTPFVVRVQPPGMSGWVMTADYARRLSAALEGAAVAVERLNLNADSGAGE